MNFIFDAAIILVAACLRSTTVVETIQILMT